MLDCGSQRSSTLAGGHTLALSFKVSIEVTLEVIGRAQSANRLGGIASDANLPARLRHRTSDEIDGRGVEW
jgi:hypothetical protein